MWYGATAGAPRPGVTGVRERIGLIGLSGETPVAGDIDELSKLRERGYCHVIGGSDLIGQLG